MYHASRTLLGGVSFFASSLVLQFYIKYFFTLPVSHLLTSTHSHHHNPSKYSWTISYVGNAIADTGNARTNMTDKPR